MVLYALHFNQDELCFMCVFKELFYEREICICKYAWDWKWFSVVPCVCETVKREAWSTSPIMVMKEEEELHSIVKKCISTHYSHGAPRGKSTGAPLMHFSVISYSLLPLFLCFSFLSSYNCVTFPSPSIPSLNLPPPLSVCLFVYLPVCLLVCLSTPWLYLNRAALLRHSTWLLECRY